jgi:hypothetical protein
MAERVLENISGRMGTFILSGAHLEAHPTHRHRYKTVKTVTVHQSKGGLLVPRTLARTMPDSLRIPAGESQVVDDAVLHCPAVKAAIVRGALRVSEPKPKPKPKPGDDDKEKDDPTDPGRPPSFGSRSTK